MGNEVPPPPPPPLPPPEPELPPPPTEPGPDGTEHPDPVGQIAAWGFATEVYPSQVHSFQVSFAWWDLAVDGQAGPDTARAVQKVLDEGGNLSPHFHMDEVRSKGNGQVLTHRELLRALEREREREIVGPIGIFSGFRDPSHNARVGGAATSQHMYGTAADKRTLVSSSEAAGFSRIGTCGDECLHGDVRHAGPNNTTGSQPGAATYWALLLTMCGPSESIYAAELPEFVREQLAATWPPPEAPKSWEDRWAARAPSPRYPLPADLYIWTGRGRPVT